MKVRRIAFYLLLIVLFGCAGSHVQTYDKDFHLPPKYTINHEWVSKKIVFLENSAVQKYGYPNVLYNEDDIGSIPYLDLAGKTAEIIGYKSGSYPSPAKFILKLDDSNLIIYAEAYGNHIGDIVFVNEKENSTKYIGKKVWNKGHPTELGDRLMHGRINCSRKIGKFEELSVVGIEWGKFSSSPLKFIFKTTDGLIASWSGSYSKINDTENHLLQPFEENWFFENPHILYADWSDRVWESIENNKIFIGMTKEQAIFSWGEPLKINKTVGSWGAHEQWVYGSQNLYFENGILMSFQSY